MPKVEIHKKTIRVGKERIPLLSGEVHYWRLNSHYWSDVLDQVKEMGLEMISTYVPWDYHEYKRGLFDFTGKTDETRNLKRFLQLTRKKGFWLIIRPGPYIYSEWPNEGAPAYVYQYHRLHSQYLKYAENYLTEIMKIIRPFFATRAGGHILSLQADNEIDPWPDRFGQQYGLNGKPGLFQEFMKELYRGNIHELNEQWGTDYGSFDETAPFIATLLKEESGLALKGDKELKRSIDYFKFKYDYSLKCARWNVNTYRRLGTDVPIFLNLYPFFYAHDWIQMQTAADFVAVDFYPSNEFREDEYEQRKIMDKVRYLKEVSPLPFIAEFGSGVWHPRHYESGVFTPRHYRLITLSALMAGIAGWNWYMLVNRDNWYMSPINEWGRTRPELSEVFVQLVNVFKKMNPPALTKPVEVGVTFNPIQYAARTLTHNSPILVALYGADVDYELYDPRKPVPPVKVLFYSGNQWLDHEGHNHLRRYVEDGGILVAFRNYPRKNERFEPSDYVGFHDPDRILFEFKRQFTVQLAPNRPKVAMVSSVFCFDKVEGRKIEANLGPYGRHTVGYRKKVGKGEIIHLGFEPSVELIREILNAIHVPLPVHSGTQEVKTALFRKDAGHYFLMVVNNGSEEKSAHIEIPHLKGKGRFQVRDVESEKAEDRLIFDSFLHLTITIPAKDGRVFELKATRNKA